MIVEKITDKYNFYQEDGKYVVDFGNVKKAEDKSATLKFSDVEEAGLLELVVKCGCTTKDKTLIDKNTATFKLSYTQCSPTFSKVVEIQYSKKKLTTIILRGQCSQ